MLSEAVKNFSSLKALEAERDMLTLQLDDAAEIHDLHSFLIEKGIVLTHLAIRKGTLEQKFLNILKESDDQTA